MLSPPSLVDISNRALDYVAKGSIYRSRSISSAEGMEFCAPLTVAESAAAAEALRRDSFSDIPNDSEAAKTPQKQSPAPTVSTTSTGKAS